MSRLILLAALAFALGCQDNKPPTQAGGKAVEIKTTSGTATVAPQ
jgi:hypothetical protein